MPNTQPITGPRISVVIPALNEALNLPYVLSLIPDDVFEVILVDGRSVDDTIAVAREMCPDIVTMGQSRRGKGNALATGFAACRGDYIVMMDADGSMDPAEISRFVVALDNGADYVKGSRFLAGGGSDDITVVRRWGNRTLNGLTNVLFGTRYSDLCYGYNAFRRHCVPVFALPDPGDTSTPARWGDGFEVETLINTRVARTGLVVREIPSFESNRRFGTSNLRTFRDGFRALVTILYERFRSAPPQPPSATAGSAPTARSVAPPAREPDRTPRLVAQPAPGAEGAT
ncbi:MAG TPA: glycosyltransferase family 2 protein [Catenuloplanes sp.]|jgi:glycosyltransferase involved in cell wall biosynthesis